MERRSFPNIRALEARGHWGIKCGLENPKALLKSMGHPESAIPVVLIAGTNGKGSTGAFMAQALKACGLTVGWTTSPHLVSPTERIWLDGHYIGSSALDLLLGEAFECEKQLDIKATYFELMFLAAVLAFRMTGVEIALVEVGMGGRWDATNALDPILTVLTNVSLDHTKFLGETREAIAREKLCTAREGRPLVLGPGLDPSWVQELLPCQPRICPSPQLKAQHIGWNHSIVDGHPIGLPGRHQVDNLATAMEALRQMEELGFPIDEKAVWAGMARTQWPGRLWKIPGLDNVWMDGAHNPDGAKVLAEHVEHCGIQPHLFFGAMGDKDLAPMGEVLKRLKPRSVTLIRGTNERYASPEQLRAIWGLEAPILDIAHAAKLLRAPAGEPRLVTGSLFLMGDLLRELEITPEI